MAGDSFETNAAGTTGTGTSPEYPLEQIRLALRGLKFGQVLVIVQDGVVVQIDRTERRRLRSVKN